MYIIFRRKRAGILRYFIVRIAVNSVVRYFNATRSQLKPQRPKLTCQKSLPTTVLCSLDGTCDAIRVISSSSLRAACAYYVKMYEDGVNCKPSFSSDRFSEQFFIPRSGDPSIGFSSFFFLSANFFCVHGRKCFTRRHVTWLHFRRLLFFPLHRSTRHGANYCLVRQRRSSVVRPWCNSITLSINDTLNVDMDSSVRKAYSESTFDYCVRRTSS